MKLKIAVAGTGAIGALMGSYMTREFSDVTMISIRRKEKANELNEMGITMEGYGESFHTEIKAEYLPEIPKEIKYDFIILTMKSNALEEAIPQLLPHLAADGIMIQTQNGINDETILKYINEKQLMTAVLFCGGAQISAGKYMNHYGFIYLGSRGIKDAKKLGEVATCLGCVRKVIVVEDIRYYQWDKLSRVCLSVPTATISGLYLGSVFKHPDTQKLFALLALELFAVAKADRHPRETVEERTEEEWRKIRDGERSGLEGREKEADWPDGIVDAYTKDMKDHQPLEVYYTNGAIAALGRKYGVPTPVNDMLLEIMRKIERGECKPGLPLLKEMIQKNL
jgi:2-dehydropantoate 2-reductase